MTVIGGRATWINNLAVNGSISVVTVIPDQPTLSVVTNIGTSLNSPGAILTGSFKLQAQTYSISVGIRATGAIIRAAAPARSMCRLIGRTGRSSSGSFRIP